jgi:hypothetical protein
MQKKHKQLEPASSGQPSESDLSLGSVSTCADRNQNHGTALNSPIANSIVVKLVNPSQGDGCLGSVTGFCPGTLISIGTQSIEGPRDIPQNERVSPYEWLQLLSRNKCVSLEGENSQWH